MNYQAAIEQPAEKQLTAEQQDAVNTVHDNPESTVLIQAYAGCAKTTTLEATAHARNDRQGALIAFNRRNADEAKVKMPAWIKSTTGHSLALSMVGGWRTWKPKVVGNVRSRDVMNLMSVQPVGGIAGASGVAYHAGETVKRFCYSASDEITADHVYDEQRTLKWFERRALDLVGGGMNPDEIKRYAMTLREQYQTAVLNTAKRLWAAMSDLRNPMPCTHDVYLKVWALGNPRLEDLGYLMVDESQDINPVLAKVIADQNTQVVYVGDPYQSIYAWRGAENAMARYAGITGVVNKHLTQSFRFGPKVADLATRILQQGYPDSEILPVQGFDQIKDEVVPTPLFGDKPYTYIARSRAAILNQVWNLVSFHKPFHVIGGINQIVNPLMDAYSLYTGRADKLITPEFMAYKDWAEFVEDAGEGDKENERLIKLIKKYGYETPMVVEQIRDQHKAYPQEGVAAILTTAHKAKGGEWDRVMLADDFCTQAWNEDDDSFDLARCDKEMINLLYVAATRAKKTLYANQAVIEVLSQ